MRVISGELHPFFETGTEGVLWSIYEEGKESYDALHVLEDGDHLTVFDPHGETIWTGVVQLEYERRYRPYPQNPQYGQQEVFGFWVHGFQADIEPEQWAEMFFDHRRAAVLVPDEEESESNE
jgi:hypothetical protein